MIQKMLMKQNNCFKNFFYVFIFSLLSSCQTTFKEPALDFEDLTNRFQKLDQDAQQKALQNKWNFYSSVFSFEDFEKKIIEEFPSLNVFPAQNTLSGKTFLNLALPSQRKSNPALILLAIDLEMELLSRYHSLEGTKSPRCLETFWSEWGLPLPLVSRSPYLYQNIEWEEKNPEVKQGSLDSAQVKKSTKALNENEKKMSAYLKGALNLDKNAEIELLTSDDLKSAQFKLQTGEIYEIFSSPVTCKEIVSKEILLPLIGKLTCLQKKNSTWIVFLSQETPYLKDQWIWESQKTCQRWARPLSDLLHKKHKDEIVKSPLYKAWSLYPRLRTRIMREANRFESAYRNSLK